MSKANDIVNYALECVDKNRAVVGCEGEHAWCAHFVSNVLRHVGLTEIYDLSCTSMQKKMSESPNWLEPEDWPVPGDIIFFDWDHIAEEKPLDHVGIVVKCEADLIEYVNGNGNSEHKVTKQIIGRKSNNIAYWMRYNEKTSNVSVSMMIDGKRYSGDLYEV